MTMTILERLQSRISLRRNLISELEADWLFTTSFVCNDATKSLRKSITALGIDQKLDKALFGEIINLTRYSEWLAGAIRKNALDSVKGD